MKRAFAILLLCCAGCAPTAAATPTPAPSWKGALFQAPTLKPDVTLTDTSGAPYNVREQTAGKVMLLYFGYTHCPDQCPTQMATIANALKSLSAAQRAKIAVVFITTDPQRDTPAVLRQWLEGFNSSFIGLTGTAAQLADAQRYAGITLAATETPFPGTGADQYFVDHAAYMLVFSEDNEAHEAFFAGISASQEVSDLQELTAGLIPS